MIFSKTLGIAYYPCCKCACTSIKSALLDYFGIPYRNPHVSLKSYQFHSVEAAGVRHTQQAPKGLLSFAVVRHPLDRLVSCYQNKIIGKGDGVPPELHECQSFDEFLSYTLAIPQRQANSHWKPQSLILPARVGRLLRFEQLQEDWQALCEEIGQSIPLPHANRTEHSSWQEYFTPEQEAQARAYYSDDWHLLEKAARLSGCTTSSN